MFQEVAIFLTHFQWVQSFILIKSLSDPSCLQCSYLCVCVCVHYGSVSSYRDGHSPQSLNRETPEKFSPRSLWLYHTVHSRSWYRFSAQVPSPQTLTIQTCWRSRGVLLWFEKRFGIQTKGKWEDILFFTPLIPEVQFLHSLDPLVHKKQVSAV